MPGDEQQSMRDLGQIRIKSLHSDGELVGAGAQFDIVAQERVAMRIGDLRWRDEINKSSCLAVDSHMQMRTFNSAL